MNAMDVVGKNIVIKLLAMVMVFGIVGVFFHGEVAKAASTKRLDASVKATLERFYKRVGGAEAVGKSAKALLVFPKLKKGALVVGGEYGRGALLVGGKIVDYYSLTSGSVGLQVGVQEKDMVIAFMSDEALANFRNSSGWEAGVDGNIAIAKEGAGKVLDTQSIKDPVVAYVFDVKGLMLDVSLKGAKFSKLDKSML
jgi:lipid-binding SYLF domain-containing protein